MWSVIHANQMQNLVTLGKSQYKKTSPAVECSFNIAEFNLPHHRSSNSWKKRCELYPKAPFLISNRIPSNSIAMWIETKKNEIEIDEKLGMKHLVYIVKVKCCCCCSLSTMKDYDKTLYFMYIQTYYQIISHKMISNLVLTKRNGGRKKTTLDRKFVIRFIYIYIKCSVDSWQ